MGKIEFRPNYLQQELDYAEEGAQEFIYAEQMYWSNFYYGADLDLSPQAEQSPYYSEIVGLIDALYISSAYRDMQEILRDYHLTQGGPTGSMRFGAREAYHPAKHQLVGKVQDARIGQTIECVQSQLTTMIDGEEYIVSEGKWDLPKVNPVSEMTDLIEETKERLALERNQ